MNLENKNYNSFIIKDPCQKHEHTELENYNCFITKYHAKNMNMEKERIIILLL